jgi:hypothetical protein
MKALLSGERKGRAGELNLKTDGNGSFNTIPTSITFGIEYGKEEVNTTSASKACIVSGNQASGNVSVFWH